jgi:hypothetical protein
MMVVMGQVYQQGKYRWALGWEDDAYFGAAILITLPSNDSSTRSQPRRL